MRLAYYAGASTAAAAACLLKAFHQRPNFYSATVYLSHSYACLLVLTNLLLLGACTFMYGLQRLLYGPLRPIEMEQLSEKAWYAVLDTLLAMPSFREDVGGWLLAMFTLLLAGKVWGWIGEGRVDILEQGQAPANPRLFHARLATSLVLSVIFDICMLDYCIETVLADPRPGMMVIFTFEFAVLCVFSLFTLARYGLSLVQIRVEKEQMEKAIAERKTEIRAERVTARQNETAEGQPTPASLPNEEAIEVDENDISVPGWEEKRRYLFALEVLTDFIKLMIYIVFFTVSITFNGLPMHIMRDVYMTFASFSKRVADYIAYKKATSDMNTRYPDATTEEIRGDACIVCRETMVAWDQAPVGQGQVAPPMAEGQQPAAPTAPAPAPASQRRDEGLRAKKLPCGHILHLRCLKAWLERQQVCPTCRRPVIVPSATNPAAAPAGVQAGAGGANQNGGGAPGQQARQPPAPRQGRARILNFGPVRIGFLNGPGDQIGNILRQMQNPGQNQQNAQQAGQAPQPGQDGGHNGPNHLGLHVPYVNGAQQPGDAVGAPRATISTRIQFQQLEQRLMQDAQNLGLEQQQLATLRAMDAEFWRLRDMQLQAAQSPVVQRQMGTLPLPPVLPWQQNPMAMMPPMAMPPPPQPIHGNAGEQMGRGHENLPEGVVLPEGWTVMPLHPTNAMAVPQVHVEPTAHMPDLSSQASQQEQQGASTQQQNSGQEAGPTDGNGSPLFIPTSPTPPTPSELSTAPPAVNGDAPDPLAAPSTEQATSSSAGTEARSPPHQRETRTLWGSDDWNFLGPNPPKGSKGHIANGDHTEGSAGENIASANWAPKETERQGKGKAAQVEDAQDSGS